MHIAHAHKEVVPHSQVWYEYIHLLCLNHKVHCTWNTKVGVANNDYNNNVRISKFQTLLNPNKPSQAYTK